MVGNPLTNKTLPVYSLSCANNIFSKIVRCGSGPERIINKLISFFTVAVFSNLERQPIYFTLAGNTLGCDKTPAILTAPSKSGTQHCLYFFINHP